MALRPESSVSLELDEYGEIVFPGDRPSPVVHRTPEELGIPRVVPDTPVRKVLNVRPDFEDSRRIAPASARGIKRDRHRALETRPAQRERQDKLRELELEMREHTIHGVPVVMSAMASMGTEMIGAAPAPETKQEIEGEKTMSRGNFARQTDELKAKVLAENDTPVPDLVSKYGVTNSQVYNWRYEARKQSGTPPARRGGRKARVGCSGPSGANLDRSPACWDGRRAADGAGTPE